MSVTSGSVTGSVIGSVTGSLIGSVNGSVTGSVSSRKTVNNVIATNQSPKYSRQNILFWVNGSLHCQLRRVEDLCTGAAYCQLMNILYPGSIRMRKVKFVCNQETEYIANFRLLQDSFIKLNIKKPFNVEQIVKGRFPENYEFAQWFRLFCEANNFRVPPLYDAIAARYNSPINIASSPLHSVKPNWHTLASHRSY